MTQRSTYRYKFTEAATIENGLYFEIPFSVRIKQDAHLFLCTLSYVPPSSDCYWILLGSHGNTRLGMRKCFEENVPWYIDTYPHDSCKPFVAEVCNHNH